MSSTVRDFVGRPAIDHSIEHSAQPASGLGPLFVEVGHALDSGQLVQALRLADRARRLAAGNTTAILLNAQLLIKLGAASAAAKMLRGLKEPEALTLLAEALCAQGDFEEASSLCAGLLNRLAVDFDSDPISYSGPIDRLRTVVSHLMERDARIAGWVGVDSSLRLTGQVRGDGRIEVSAAARILGSLASTSSEAGVRRFHFGLPPKATGELTISIDGRPLLGSGLLWPPDFGLSSWVLRESSALVGEVRLAWLPKQPITLCIGRTGEAQHRRYSMHREVAAGRHSFSIPLNTWERQAASLDVTAILPNGDRVPVAGSPLHFSQRAPVPIGARPQRSVSSDVHASNGARLGDETIDVIIPVYAGHDETLVCIESVLRSQLLPADGAVVEVVVVDDASPDARLREALAALAANGAITLLTNKVNVGFPGAANVGMRLHPGRDVVLLNSDAEVAGNWVERMLAAAYSSADIGTVTAMSEGGSVTDYARQCQGDCPTAAEIDRIAARENRGGTVEIPVGVGLCLYIKRRCLEETGEFDEIAFARGYGEESDFCLRARELGWRHLASTGVFVGHLGGRSYGASTEALKRRNGLVLNSFHPGYDAMINEFSALNPLLAARRAIDIGRLKEKSVRPVLLTTLDLPGGVKRHVGERQAELEAAGHTVLVLRSQKSVIGDGTPPPTLILEVGSLALKHLLFELPRDQAVLGDLLIELDLYRTEMHHFLGLGGPILEMIAKLGVPYHAYIHDYSWICPRVTLIGGSGRYCGEPPVQGCEACVREHGSELDEPLTVTALRERSGWILRGADAVIAPSEDARNRIARYYPDLHVSVTAWEDNPVPALVRSPSSDGRLRVAVIGAIGLQKGYEVLLACARDAKERDLDLEFVVIGYSSADDPLIATGRIFITGGYEETEAGSLLDREQCDVAFFPSLSPETWCYSLTHALTRGLPVLAFDSGALAERLRDKRAAKLLPLTTSIASINDSLLALAGRVALPKEETETFMSHVEPPTELSQTRQTQTEQPKSAELSSSVQVLTLPAGIYSFTSTNAQAAVGMSDSLTLPSLQIGLAPAPSLAKVEFLTGASAMDRWLAYNTDMIVVRIFGGDATLLLTSLRLPESPVLAVEVKRLNADSAAPAVEAPVAPGTADGRELAPQVKVLTHIRNVGDLQFSDSWAGWPGQQLWIEGFAILPIGPLPEDSLDYQGVAFDGYQTPWLSHHALCGTRGTGMPMLGYAVRLRPELAKQYDCRYSGKFSSGATIGPLQDGAMCRSLVPGDPLEAMEIKIVERQTHQAAIGTVEPRYAVNA